ncbi:hypothetical protein [Roseobacter sinensis]|uniref:Uncharacterized protein n=1 Tax=Roseobacter sinensis TaxID=2931391 RepID=A0ABT3BEG8_9RHOB|nr:hypothetical protein [Roseobacter sp. WL0113]MCV3271948.1 hypothetical protein [Roseobacter sp. WL0113]
MDQTPKRIITREKQQLAEMEREFAEVERQQDERFEMIEGKRRRLAAMGVVLDD